MPSTIAALDPISGSRGLLVEVHPELTQVAPEVVQAFSERMFLRNIRVGMIVARKDTIVLRDTLSSMRFRDNRYERHALDTDALFTGAKIAAPLVLSGPEFVKCVVLMLEAIASSWYSFLHESAVPAMVPDVVGNLAQANLEVWDGLLEQHDAAEWFVEMTPVVYCETNWIVALAFPHHQLHGDAKALRSEAHAGNCRLRIPMTALLEARGTLGDVASQLAASFTSLRNDLATGVRNGLTEFSVIASTLQSDVVDKYTQWKTLSILDEIQDDAAITVLLDVTSNFEVLRELRAKVDLRGKDVVDLHLLAAIIKDRREDTSAPALFMSHNKKEFDPRKKKVPEALYYDVRLLWRDDFKLSTGVGQWNSKFGTSGS